MSKAHWSESSMRIGFRYVVWRIVDSSWHGARYCYYADADGKVPKFWTARAARKFAEQLNAEQAAECEAVEAVAYLLIDDSYADEHGDWDIEPIAPACDRLAALGAGKYRLMTVAQHERIVTQLQAHPAAQAVPDEWRSALQGLTDDIENLICESDGVTGFHRSGDTASWGELLPGGRFERLTYLAVARDLLATTPTPPAGKVKG